MVPQDIVVLVKEQTDKWNRIEGQKPKDKKSLESSQIEMMQYLWGIPIQITIDFSFETMGAIGSGTIFQVLK